MGRMRKLDKRGHSYHVVNEGISGDTTDTGLVRTEIVGVQNTTVQAASGVANDMLGPATALLLQFASNGDLAAVSIGGNPGDPTLGVALTLAGDSNRQACIYPTGYAADAVCV